MKVTTEWRQISRLYEHLRTINVGEDVALSLYCSTLGTLGLTDGRRIVVPCVLTGVGTGVSGVVEFIVLHIQNLHSFLAVLRAIQCFICACTSKFTTQRGLLTIFQLNCEKKTQAHDVCPRPLASYSTNVSFKAKTHSEPWWKNE